VILRTHRVLLLALVATTSERAMAATVVRDPSCGRFAVVQQSERLQYTLPQGFLRPAGDSVWTATAAYTRGVDYTIDRTRGILRLLRAPVPGETLWVAACWLLHPPPLERQLQSYRLAGPVDSAAAVAPGATIPRPITARLPAQAPAGTALTLSGNKTLAVDFGSSQDAFLRQSLDLGVTGTLAPGVELTGVLSDRSTPLTAGGSTQDLQSVDRLLIELRAPHGGAALGDVGLQLQSGEFARLERRLQGVRGEWGFGVGQGVVAAASSQGEYHVLQFFGVEGRQGPYQLTDRNGNSGISVVAGSEVVTLNGARLTRGESADYAMDYERGRITFTNRRPIGSSSRIAVEYQFTVNRFRRNLAAASARFGSGAWHGHTTLLAEGDDKGRPLDLVLDASDRLVLEAAGDSTSAAVGGGVSNGGGDYDLVQDSTRSWYAFAGPDSGNYSVRFARVGAGRGDYVDSAVVAGRIAYRHVGPGQGTYRIGRALPLPESHQLWSVGGGFRRGGLAFDLEGALSRRDLNTFSALGDADNLGHAGHARLALEGASPSWLLGGTAGITAQARAVGERFAPFARLERPFAEEDWGLPVGADLEHQARAEVSAFVRPRIGGELRAGVGRLETPGGFQAWRRTVELIREGVVVTRARWDRSDGTQEGRSFPEGGRDRRIAEIGLRTRWLEPLLRGEWDERLAPSDSARVGNRSRELTAELRSARHMTWNGVVGWSVRRSANLEAGGFVDQGETHAARIGVETPVAGRIGAALMVQSRIVRPLANPLRTRSDLASARFRASDPARGLSGTLNFEITSEGENERTRVLTFVGAGRGAYDSLGNFVGTGDYDLLLSVSPNLRQVARAATSARATWQFGASEAWRGSRVEFGFESEARRRGDLLGPDAMLTPAVALGDARLSRGAVTQRLEAELAPGSRAAALRLRIERRVSADRSFENFAQQLDERTATSRWRVRPSGALSGEIEARWKRQEARQELSAGAGFVRVLFESGGLAQLVYTPDARLRTAAVMEAAWTRPDQPVTPEATRTVRLGPDVGLAIGSHGRIELSGRRAFVAGPPLLTVLPTAPELAGPPRWEATARGDYRVRESTTVGLTFTMRDRDGRPTEHMGRAEVRAFF
jgi:hypothetical protein